MAIFLHSRSGVHAYWYSQLWLQNCRGIPSLPNDCQQHSALPKTRPLSPCWSEHRQHRALQLQREAWPISAHTHWHSLQDSTHACGSMHRGFCTLVLFIFFQFSGPPLVSASENGHLQVIRLLTSRGAVVDCKSKVRCSHKGIC